VLADAETADAANELLLRYNIASLPDTHVYVCQEEPAGRASAASKKLLAYLKKHSSVSMEFPVLTGTPLAQWIIDACATQGCAIAPAAISGLIQRAGGDSWRLAQEIAKLCAFTYASGEKSITPNAVHQLVPAVYERDEWELSNALAGKDKRGVLSALFRRISEGTPEQLLLGSLAAGIRTLMTVKDLSERHTPPALIAKTAALHPYVVTKTLRGASLYTSAQLRQTLSQLARLDREFKDGRADATDSLFQIVLEL
jgi:DNA polymerase III delta subunit